jgi:uncharacterized protein (DUF2147 family)
MRALKLAGALTFAGVLAAGPALAADPVEGEWMVGATTRVKIAPCPAKTDHMCGVIGWLKSPNDKDGQPTRDTANPDPKLRGRPIVGMPFITDFHRAAPGAWAGGRIYDPDSGKTYESKMHIDPDGTLKVAGCVLVFCQNQTWRRPVER